MSLQNFPTGPSPRTVKFVQVKTTLPTTPFPPNTEREPIVTDRLIIRPWRQSDLDQIRILRTQSEVMCFTRAGRVDGDMSETQAWLDRFLSPAGQARTYSFALTLKSTGEVIGTGGVHQLKGDFGWPELGYLFRSEYWGQGYATEFLRALRDRWRELPREEVEIEVDPRTVTTGAGEEDGRAEEYLVAITADHNAASQNVLRKCGWEHFMTFTGEDGTVLPVWRMFPTRKGQ